MRENEVLNQSASAIFDNHECNFTNVSLSSKTSINIGVAKLPRPLWLIYDLQSFVFCVYCKFIFISMIQLYDGTIYLHYRVHQHPPSQTQTCHLKKLFKCLALWAIFVGKCPPTPPSIPTVMVKMLGPQSI